MAALPRGHSTGQAGEFSVLKLSGESGLISPMFSLPAVEHQPNHGLMELAWKHQQNPHSAHRNCGKKKPKKQKNGQLSI